MRELLRFLVAADSDSAPNEISKSKMLLVVRQQNDLNKWCLAVHNR